MKSLFAFVLALLVCPALAQTPATGQRLHSSMEGTVVNAQGGEPLRKATVEAISDSRTSGEPLVYVAITDSEGRFKIETMDPGRYRLFIERTGFIPIDQHHRSSEGLEVTVQPGKPVKDLVLRAIPAAAVVGRVVDEDGDPMPNVGISILRMGYATCRPQLDTVGTERTNDLGEYRVGGLAPGKYFVSANPLPTYTGANTSKDATAKPETSYVSTYYPGVTDPAQAASVELHPGESLPVDFSLTPVPSFRVLGRVANIESITPARPGVKGIVVLRSKSLQTVGHEAEIDSVGNFEFRAVPPGSYTVTAVVGPEDSPTPPQTVELTSADLTNVQLVAGSGAHIRGTLRLDNHTDTDLTGFRIYLRSVGQDQYLGLIGSDEAKVNRDGSFELSHLPAGVYDINVAGTSGSSTFFIKQVRSGGRDISDTSVRVGANAAIQIDVIASPALSQVEGSVTDHDQPAANATVVAVPSPARRGVLEHYQTTLTDQTGRFRFAGLRPDDYTFLAWDDVESGAWCNPDFLKTYESAGEHAHLGENDRETVHLKLISTQADYK